MSKKIYSMKEVEEETKNGKHLIVIFDKVYDVGPFLNKHPGGEEVLMDASGKDSTDDFEDIGHSTDAREMMVEFEVGELTEEDKKKVYSQRTKYWETDTSPASSSWTSWLVPIGLAVAASAIYRMIFQS